MGALGITSTLWRRHQNPWNWLVQFLGLLLICLAVWLRSLPEGLAGAGLLLAGVLDFRMPGFPQRGRFAGLVRRMIRAEVIWVNKPWDRAKRRQAALLALGCTFLFGVLALGSVPGLGLSVGGFFLLWARAANRRAGVDP